MKIPQTIEKALADIIKTYPIGAQTMIRCWHIIRNDYKWKSDTDRVLPCIDLRCAPMTLDATAGSSAVSEIQITIQTQAEDDEDHKMIADIESAVQEAVDSLYSSFRHIRSSPANAKYIAFKAAIDSACTSVKIGGITLGAPLMPFDEDGLNTVGITLSVHYHRSDF